MENYYFFSMDIYTILFRIVTLIGILFIVRMLFGNSRILNRIDLREQRVQEDLALRALELEEKTARIAEEIKVDAEKREAEAKIRHALVIEASLKSRTASEITAAAVTHLVGAHADEATVREQEHAEVLVERELVRDTNVVVRETKDTVTDIHGKIAQDTRALADQLVNNLAQNTNTVVNETKDTVNTIQEKLDDHKEE